MSRSDGGKKGASPLLDLFAEPGSSQHAPLTSPAIDVGSPSADSHSDNHPGLPSGVSSGSRDLPSSEVSPLLRNLSPTGSYHAKNASKDRFQTEVTPQAGVNRKSYVSTEGATATHNRAPSVAMPSIKEFYTNDKSQSWSAGAADWFREKAHSAPTLAKRALRPTTFIGSFVYLLYHVVFCLALGSPIIRPHSTKPILGLMTKMAALGPISAAPVYWFALSSEIPALYPTADLFLAPFLANLAAKVDQTLARDTQLGESDNDAVFMATFGFLSAIGICFSGSMLLLSAVFKLANLGSFLPFPVICGFFSAVGILTWTLAVTVDTGGTSIGTILSSGDSELMTHALIHHIPGVLVAGLMKYLGPKNPLFVVMIVLCTIVLFYTVMFIAGITLEEAKEDGWFWSYDELVYMGNSGVGFSDWAAPAPLGVINQVFQGHVHWKAVKEGLPTAIAMGFLYLIRCSVHAAALKKNVPNLARSVKSAEGRAEQSTTPAPQTKMPPSVRVRKFSEAVDIEAVMQFPVSTSLRSSKNQCDTIVRAKPTNISLRTIFVPYGASQWVSALFGAFAITPSVAASTTMFSLGADGVAPQVGSVLLLFIFYMTDFQLVGYIPKPAFSSMLVLAFIDMIYTWFYKSYFKTKDKMEWMVVPAIVVCAFTLDLLSAVFLGIAMSTFIFVSSFFRSGVVKYAADGSVIQSTIERPFRLSDWLNQSGAGIQVLVLHNYLFFGNATSVYTYIASMFQRDDEEEIELDFLPRYPRYLLLDLQIVTGMDTSTVDIFNEIRNLCASNNCKLFVSGVSTNLRAVLALGGFKPETGVRSQRKVRFFASLDAALGKAEDMLIDSEYDEKMYLSSKSGGKHPLRGPESGFVTALRAIDEEHGEESALKLVDLEPLTKLVELKPGEKLYDVNQTPALERGLFFIETGIIKIEHDTGATMTRGSQKVSMPQVSSLAATQALKNSILLQSAGKNEQQPFRLARIGPGWIVGTMEAVASVQFPGEQVAVTKCRLHHLPFSSIREIERNNPSQALTLYKLLSYLVARRQEATIGQLATLHSIMSSPSQGIGRDT